MIALCHMIMQMANVIEGLRLGTEILEKAGLVMVAGAIE